MSLPRSYATTTDGALTSASATLAIGSLGERGGQTDTSTSIASSVPRLENVKAAIDRHMRRKGPRPTDGKYWNLWFEWWVERHDYLHAVRRELQWPVTSQTKPDFEASQNDTLSSERGRFVLGAR